MGKTKTIFQVLKYQALLKSQQPKEFLDIFIYVHNCTLPIFTPYHYASSLIHCPFPSPKVVFLLLCKQTHIDIYVPNMRPCDICLSFFSSSNPLSSFLHPFLKTSSSPTSLFVSIFIPHLCLKSEFCT